MRTEYVILFLLMGLATYFTRASFLVFSKRINMPDHISRSLKYIPPAILATLIFPGIFIPNGELNLAVTNPYIWAAGVTIGTVLVSKNSVAGIVLGIASLVVFRTFI